MLSRVSGGDLAVADARSFAQERDQAGVSSARALSTSRAEASLSAKDRKSGARANSALAWGVVVWVFPGEMFPDRIRAAALGVAASAQRIANGAIAAGFPSLAGWNLSATYVTYTVFAALSIPAGRCTTRGGRDW